MTTERKTQAERQQYIDEHQLEPWTRVVWRGMKATYLGTTAQSMASIRIDAGKRAYHRKVVCPTRLTLDWSDYTDEMKRLAEKRMPL
jgi:hypothetical protein